MGLLLGVKGQGGVSTVTHLLLPKQRGEPSFCEMADDIEEALKLNTFLEEKQLITIGWAHTHPQVEFSFMF